MGAAYRRGYFRALVVAAVATVAPVGASLPICQRGRARDTPTVFPPFENPASVATTIADHARDANSEPASATPARSRPIAPRRGARASPRPREFLVLCLLLLFVHVPGDRLRETPEQKLVEGVLGQRQLDLG